MGGRYWLFAGLIAGLLLLTNCTGGAGGPGSGGQPRQQASEQPVDAQNPQPEQPASGHIPGDVQLTDEARALSPENAEITIDPAGRMINVVTAPPSTGEQVGQPPELPPDVALGQLGERPAPIPPRRPPDPLHNRNIPRSEGQVDPLTSLQGTGNPGEAMPMDPNYIPPDVQQARDRERQQQEQQPEPEQQQPATEGQQ